MKVKKYKALWYKNWVKKSKGRQSIKNMSKESYLMEISASDFYLRRIDE